MAYQSKNGIINNLGALRMKPLEEWRMYNAENEKHQSCGAKLGWKYECISPAV